MSISEMLGVGVAGFIAGLFLFNGVLRWVGTIFVLAKDPTHAGRKGKAARILLATIFGSGLWLLAVAVGGIYFVHAEPYATSLFSGTALAIVYMGLVVTVFLLKQRAKGGRNAA